MSIRHQAVVKNHHFSVFFPIFTTLYDWIRIVKSLNYINPVNFIKNVLKVTVIISGFIDSCQLVEHGIWHTVYGREKLSTRRSRKHEHSEAPTHQSMNIRKHLNKLGLPPKDKRLQVLLPGMIRYYMFYLFLVGHIQSSLAAPLVHTRVRICSQASHEAEHGP